MASVYCACRDCFDIATGDTVASVALCLECEEAGCEVGINLAHESLAPLRVMYDCQRKDAYGVERDA